MSARDAAEPPARPEPSSGATGWTGEIRATVTLAWPLVVSQLAQFALLVTDIIMMGWLGPEFLAAGTLANAVLHPLQLTGFGVASAVAPLIAQAIGAREFRAIRRITRQGLWAMAIMAAVLIPIVLQVEPILIAAGQDRALAAVARSYMQFAAWFLIPIFGVAALRAFLSSHSDTAIILWITLVGVAVNALGNYSLMFGNFGLPRLELAGAGISTTFTATVMCALMFAYVLTHRRYRRYAILARFFRPDWPRLRQIFRIGLPIGLMLLAEIGLFSGAALLMGWVGADELAAHAVALNLAAVAFMVPLGVGQAATVRVGLAFGAGDVAGVARAGWTAFGIGVAFMALSAISFLVVPEFLMRLYLGEPTPELIPIIAYGVSFLAIAALFQVFDGAQVVMAFTLRGLSDTRVPMFIAMVGYWLIGLPLAWVLAFPARMGGIGIWLGLAASLAFVAVLLITRFARRERLGLLVRQRL